MSHIRRQLENLFSQCTAVCNEYGHFSPRGTPNFRLLYSSVESFERGNGILVLGINPAGPSQVADFDDRRKPFEDPAYCSYLDDEWSKTGRKVLGGQAALQRAVQDVFMVLAGRSIDTIRKARQDNVSFPAKRIGRKAETLLRGAASGNIIPFRSKTPNQISPELRQRGYQIGWQLTKLAKPRVVIALANGENGSPWAVIREFSGQRDSTFTKLDVHQGLKRSYKELKIESGPLDECLLVGLPSLVRDKGRDYVMNPLLNILNKRLSIISNFLPE